MTELLPGTFKFRRGPASAWASENPVLALGEPGLDADAMKIKLGDGVHAWDDLPWYPDIAGSVVGVASVDGRTGEVELTDLYAAIVHAHSMSDVTGLTSALSGKAATSHTHVESDTTNLVSDLAGKAASVHTHSESDVTGLVTDLATLATAISGKASATHVHPESDVTNLVTDLAGKAATSHVHAAADTTSGTFAIGRIPTGTSGTTVALGDHGHVESDVANLVSDLAGKAAASHTHVESDTTNLVSDLAAKAASVHTHAESDVTSLVSDLAGKAATSHVHAAADTTSGTFAIGRIPTGTSGTTVSLGNHGHAEADVTNLVSDLAGKAASVHTHAESDVTSLVSDLAGKAATSHVHAGADITSGSVAIARLPTGTSSSTVSLGNHTHVEADTTNLVSDLAGKAATNHAHVTPPVPSALTDASTIATDASLGNYFRVTLGSAVGATRSLGAPSNPSDEQKVIWEFLQDGSGSRALTLNAAFIFGTDLTSITLSTAANKRDLMGAIYNATLAKWLVVMFIKGF